MINTAAPIINSSADITILTRYLESKTSIKVQLQVEGLHRWATCDLENVDYLKHLHRHNFIITCERYVTHSDRDVEFIDFKHRIRTYLEDMYYSERYECLNFNGMSCEQIAIELATQFDLSKCEVSEDGEFWGISERTQLSYKPTSKVIAVCGLICSGKTSYIENLKKSYQVVHISISNIVKNLIQSNNRSELQKTQKLSKAIADDLIKQVKNALASNTESYVVVDGIRQSSILDALVDAVGAVNLIWLEVPVEERKRRYEERSWLGDNQKFEVADNQPIEMEARFLYKRYFNQ